MNKDKKKLNKPDKQGEKGAENSAHKEDFDWLLTEASKGDKASDKTSKPDSC